MSIDTTVYIGPFALCKNGIVSVEVKIKACTTKGCGNFHVERYDKSNFCNLCGGPIVETGIPRQVERVNSGQLLEDVGFQMTIASQEYGFKELKECDVWINNIRDKEVGRTFDPKHECFSCIPSNPAVIATEIEIFERECADSLAKLREAYGPENVEIKWGVLGWLS